MCGICGIYAFGCREGAVDEATIETMAAAMRHRGPDDGGVYLDSQRRLGLGFRRLAIVDLSASGHQPMCNEDGTVWIVFNGEIYNHSEHRRTLESKGHVYRGRSDTETILHLYEEYGENCVHHLRGMFAFAIWDQNRKSILLARDRLGIKPLYFALNNGRLFFASEIKALLAIPEFPRRINFTALFHYLTFAVPPAPLTMFEGIHKLPAGYWMRIDRDGSVHQERYWDAIVPAASDQIPPREHAERLLCLLRESVHLRMMSDVPLGVLLSGGLDSSTITALMAENSTEPINTFSVGFRKYDSYNELQPALDVARAFNTNHHEVVIDEKEALEYIPRMVESQDEPIADWVCVPLYFVTKLARDQGVIVANVGEGADELFCGYSRYAASLFLQRAWPLIRWLPERTWSGALRMGAFANGTAASKCKQVLQMITDHGARFQGASFVFAAAAKNSLLDTPLWRRGEDSAAVVDAIYRHHERVKPEADNLERMIYLELKLRLAELLLMRVDKIAMSNSVEARVPFLDHKLVGFAMSLPARVKLRYGVTKAVLRRAVRDVVPAKVIARRKQGFAAPVAEWFRNELADDAQATVLHGSMMKAGFFNRDFVSRLFAEHRSGRANRAIQLWNLYNVEMWYRHWMN